MWLPFLTWLRNLSGGRCLALFNKAPAVQRWSCFWALWTNEPVVWHSASSGFGSGRSTFFLCVWVWSMWASWKMFEILLELNRDQSVFFLTAIMLWGIPDSFRAGLAFWMSKHGELCVTLERANRARGKCIELSEAGNQSVCGFLWMWMSPGQCCLPSAVEKRGQSPLWPSGDDQPSRQRVLF